MKAQDENSKGSLESHKSEASTKKEWNAPDIKIVTPIKKTAGGAGTTGGFELGGYVNAS